jgi:methyl-accepting chemotaxis protein
MRAKVTHPEFVKVNSILPATVARLEMKRRVEESFMSDDHGLAERLDFIGLDHESRRSLKEIRPQIQSEIKVALTKFYSKVRSTPQTRKFFKDDAHMGSAQARQQSHWDVISQADFGPDYVGAVRTVGETHARIGLEPRWYIGGYAMVSDHLIRALIADKWPKAMFSKGDGGKDAGQAILSLMKAVLLDMDFAISIYLETIESERVRLEAERARNQACQDALVEGLGVAFEKLARGDLTARMSAEVSQEFQTLKDNFNKAMADFENAMGQVSDTIGSIQSGVDEIGSAADDLSRRTEQQAASLEETAAALEEITTTVRRSAEGAKQASQVVSAAKGDAETSGAVVGDAVEAMGQIEGSSSQITQIIGVIDEIAFQTNLLALNAGVEAARAGDAGKGFAVVASEVRALAQRSAEAAKEIKALISASTQQVESGVRLVGQTGDALQGIVSKVAQIDGLVSEISASAQEQSTGLHQVNIAINQMDQVTQQNAAMVEETTAATHALKSQTADLVELVSGFTLGQRQAQAGRKPRPAVSRASGGYSSGGATARKLQAEPAAEGWQEF